MAPKRYFRTTHRAQRSANTTQPFFQPAASEAEHAGGQNSFFPPAPVTVQAQMTVEQPGDRYEQEADAMADRVVNSSSSNATVASAAMGSGQGAVQRAAQPKEEEKLQRAAKPEEEEKVQRAAKPEEEEKVQRAAKPEEEEKVQRAAKPEEEEKVQRAEQKEEEKDKPMLHTFAPGSGGTTVGPSTAARINSSRGGGSPLPAPARQEMSSAFGHDFSTVRIHTDGEAASLSDGLGAHAFTVGQDVYFNRGKFNPDSGDGKRLLAHELTHVVQQGGVGRVQRKDVAEASTPVPDTFAINQNRKMRFVSATGMVGGVAVTILPDKIGPVKKGSDGVTVPTMRWQPPKAATQKDGSVIVEGTAVISLSIQTTYSPKADKTSTSAYGKGTTPADQKGGNTTLRFHEGSHGTDAIDYLINNPVPTFGGSGTMTQKDYKAAVATFMKDMQNYYSTIMQNNLDDVDCVGTKATFCPP